MDKYNSMNNLQYDTTESEDWEIEINDCESTTSILAIHGGGIEPATTELTKLIASQGNFNYFTFNGLRSKGNNELHVTSIHYDNELALELVGKSQNVITLHGCQGNDAVVYLGGKDKELIHLLKNELIEAGFNVEKAPKHMSGTQKENITNLSQKKAGVQIELSTEFRKQLFKNKKFNHSNRINRENWSDTMYQFSDAILKALNQI